MSVSPFSDQATRGADSQALDWFVRRGRGLSAAEEAELQAWLDADAGNAAALERWEADWKNLDALPADGIAALKRGIAQEKAAGRQGARRGFWSRLWAAPAFGQDAGRGGSRPWVSGMAAALVVVMAASLGWWIWQRPDYEHSFATARGEQLDETLPDGSRLRLDTATRVTVVFRHGRREVRLSDGQAYFQVEHDPGRPFDVLAGPLRVTDLGTRFSVRYTPEIAGNDGVQVAVEEGRVRVGPASRFGLVSRLWNGGHGAAVVLAAGQQVASDAGGGLGQVSPVPEGEIAAWRDNRISFDNTPLAQALAEFERYGPTHLTAGPRVAALGVTGTFNPRKLENFTRILPQALPVQLRRHGDVTEIVASPR